MNRLVVILFAGSLLSQSTNIDTILISNQDLSEKDFFNSSYKLERWFSSEGNSEGLSDVWLDRYLEPRDINLMNYDDIMSLPSLSPIDANAVIKQKERGRIDGEFQLKNSPGITYYGYKNLKDFINFDTHGTNQFHLRYSSLVRTTPITTNPDSDESILLIDHSASNTPEHFHKISLSYMYGNNQSILKTGMLFSQHMGQSKDVYTFKKYAELSYISLFKNLFQIDHFVIGNFTASFGQGVVFESTDYFSPRRSGYGFTKRNDGIRSDNTRSSQYVLNGFGLQLSNEFLRIIYFSSESPRDAILNEDGESFTCLISMQPRQAWGVNNDSTKIYSSLISSVNERTAGFNARLGKGGNFIGGTYYRSLYDKFIIPMPIETILGSDDDDNPEYDVSDFDDYSGDAFYLSYITNSADSEIEAMYQSSPNNINSSWAEAKSYRHVVGIDFSTTIKNIVFQGEIARMPMSGDFISIDNPQAMVINAYAQFDNINFLALYRNYDLEFDNPYQRSFSNYQRYKTSIFEDTYWLEDPIYGFLYSGNPQPQAEEGFFLSSRYQIHKSVVLRYDFDTWNRKSDNAKYYRTVFNFEWRPVFNYRIYIRQKFSGRGQYNTFHPSPFDSRETRFRFVLRLSNYDNLELLYSRGYTTFSPRPRLTDPYMGIDMLVGDIGDPETTLGFSFTHNMDKKISIKGGTVFVKGFIWYIEDNDFRIFDSLSGSIHNWLSIRYRPSNYMSVYLKYSFTDSHQSTTITAGQTMEGYWISNPLVNEKTSDYKIQVNYAF